MREGEEERDYAMLCSLEGSRVSERRGKISLDSLSGFSDQNTSRDRACPILLGDMISSRWISSLVANRLRLWQCSRRSRPGNVVEDMMRQSCLVGSVEQEQRTCAKSFLSSLPESRDTDLVKTMALLSAETDMRSRI